MTKCELYDIEYTVDCGSENVYIYIQTPFGERELWEKVGFETTGQSAEILAWTGKTIEEHMQDAIETYNQVNN